MFRREITKSDVVEVVNEGIIIADYPEDNPHPSCLMLGFVNGKPIHAVLAFDAKNNTGIIITAYTPDSRLWGEDFKSRRDKT